MQAAAMPARRKRISAPERTAALMAVALDLFARRNFSAVTIKDIAGELGINTALLYYYFDNKEDLLRATIEDTVERAFKHFSALRVRHSSPADVIADWLDSHIDLSKPIQNLVKVSLDYRSSRLRCAAIDRAIRRFYNGEAKVLSQCIEEGMAIGLFAPVDAVETAQFISGYLDGLMVRSVIHPRMNLRASVAQFRSILWRHLGYTGEVLVKGPRAVATAPLPARGSRKPLPVPRNRSSA